MKCQICLKRQAVLHIQETVDGEKREIHICRKCADERKIFPEIVAPNFSLDAITGEKEKKKEKPPLEKVSLLCPECGFDFSQVNSGAQMGCPKCYESFHEFLRPLLKSIHGETIHRGRRIGENRHEIRNRLRKETLSRKLERVLRDEDYETAAKIRDQILKIDRSGN